MRGVCRFQRTALGEVALEVRRVDFERVNMTRMSELDDGPIVSWATPPFCFPAVAHVRGASWHDQVVPVTKEHVAARKHERAVFGGGEIDVARTLQSFPIGHDFAVHTQARYA